MSSVSSSLLHSKNELPNSLKVPMTEYLLQMLLDGVVLLVMTSGTDISQ